MKELSIEEKAKAYDKVVERLKDFRFEYRFSAFGDVIEEKFPELKSEDMRIREALVDIIEHFLFWKDKGLTKEKVLDWLEKQGEQKSDDIRTIGYWNVQEVEQNPADKVEPKFKVGDKIISNISNIPYYIIEVCNGHYLTDVGCIIMFNAQDNFELIEQNPAWSEEDEVKINRIVACLENLNVADNDILLKDVDWLKSLKDRYTWKPSSELDEASYQVGIKRVLENPESYGLTKYNWKPSDEQMERLKGTINSLPHQEVLYSLYQDLKKLRGGGIVMTKQEAIDKGYREFKGEGYTVLAHPRSCFFCDHCTDITYDFSNGPYMFDCNVEFDPDHIDMGLKGMCNNFKEE